MSALLLLSRRQGKLGHHKRPCVQYRTPSRDTRRSGPHVRVGVENGAWRSACDWLPAAVLRGLQRCWCVE